MNASLLIFKNNTGTQTNSEKKGFILHVVYSPSLEEVRAGARRNLARDRNQSRDLEEAGSLLSCCPWLAQFHFLYSPGPPAQGRSLLTGVGSPTSFLHEGDALQTCPLNGGSFFPDDPSFFKLTKTSRHKWFLFCFHL